MTRTQSNPSAQRTPATVGGADLVHRTQPVRVANLISTDAGAVGGVLTWAARWADGATRLATGHLVHTLVLPSETGGPPAHPIERVVRLREMIEAVDPAAIVCCNTDLCLMAAHQVRAVSGGHVKLIVAARTDDLYNRSLLEQYNLFDGGVAVSRPCAAWLADVARRAGDPDCPIIVAASGAPVAPAPRPVSPGGPLTLAYVGRLDQPQKRVGDLVLVASELRRLGIQFKLHIVGDGPEMPALAAAVASQSLVDAVLLHGARSAEWVQGLWQSVDCLLLPSAAEGASVAMQEAMGAGVVPIVTRISGVDDWVTHGHSGMLVEVGRPIDMARAVAGLATDRSRLAAMGAAAWNTARQRGGIDAMVRAYGQLIDRVVARPDRPVRTDLGVRRYEGDGRHVRGGWPRAIFADAGRCDELLAAALQQAGYRRIAIGTPADGTGVDAVLAPASQPPPSPEQVARWRAAGLGVAVSAAVLDHRPAERMARALEALQRDGSRRILIYGTGRHTRGLEQVIRARSGIVGIIDDAPSSESLFGLPVTTPGRALAELNPDAVVLSSDRHEAELAARWRAMAQAQSARSVRVVGLYGHI